MREIIEAERSLMPAADLLSTRELPQLLQAVVDIPTVLSIKLGFTLAFDNLREATQIIHEYKTGWKVVYDHQKAGCDIPRNGEKFAYKMKEAGVDAAIIFPLAGIETEMAWIKALQDAEVPVIVGGEMTHEGFFVSEGGFIADDAPERMYKIAAGMGVRNFFLPGNKPNKVEIYREQITNFTDGEDFTVYSCGYITQRGDIRKTGRVAGPRSHIVIGEAIYAAGGVEAMHQAALMANNKLMEAA